MNKFLLSAALVAVCASASAEDFSKLFKITYNGETVESGQTVTDGCYYDPILKEYPELAGDDWDGNYESKAEIFATNISEEPLRLEFRMRNVAPTAEEFEANSALGFTQLCFFNQNGEGNCILPDFDFNSETPKDPVSAEEYMRFDVEHKNFTDLTPVIVKLEMRVTDEGKEIANAHIFVNFTNKTDITMAVDGIQAESSSEFYTIQGMRVAEPQKGQIYIERKGSKVTKRIF
ncbi:MAG: hypothetical protein K2L45_01705 [Muribaculaceae bacterium]|nr:hypothetical protein [Muribaculaceae bacterium]